MIIVAIKIVIIISSAIICVCSSVRVKYFFYHTVCKGIDSYLYILFSISNDILKLWRR